jgi:PAS domain S-box-containing protein
MKLFERLFDPTGLTPHGFCLTWDPALLWLDVTADAMICVAYFAISLSLIHLARRRNDLRPRWLAFLFAGVILACGITHAMSIVTVWSAVYVAEGAAKLFSAILSVATAVVLVRLLPKLLSFPSHDDMARLNRYLQDGFVEQQKIASELGEKKRWLLMAQEAGHIGSWRLDLSGEIAHWSPSQYVLYGLRSADTAMHRAAWFELVVAEDRDRLAAALAKAIADGGDYEAEFRVTLPDGSVRWLSEHGRLVVSDIDDLSLLAGVSVDVTKRNRLTQQLTETNQRLFARAAEHSYAHEMAVEQLRVMFEHSPDCLFVVRVEHGSTPDDQGEIGFTMEAINTTTATMMGREPAEIIGQPVQLLHRAEAADELIAAYRTCLLRNTVTTVTTRYTIAGRAREFDVSLAPVQDPRTGTVSRLIGVGRDMTERAEVERGMRQLAKMEATHRLTAGVAHDFNNMLQALMGALEMLLIEVESDSTREYAEIALAAAQRGAALTQRLLAFTRQQALQPSPVDADRLIGGMSALLAPTLPPQVSLAVSQACAPIITLADPAQLEAALVNLVVNAAEAMPQGGQVELGAAIATHVAGLDLPLGTYAVFSVSDSGTGMTPEILQQACEPFFTTKGPSGSGLGLSMVQGFARQSGGDLSIDSEPGRGTTVRIWLPLAQQSEELRDAAPHVLLVDDAADVLVTAGAFLRHAGFQVTRVSSGQAAMAHLATGVACDAIVTDYAMPDMNGMDLLREAREMRPGIPGLVITGLDRTAMRAQEVGARVVQKPFSRSALIEEVSALLDRITV